MTPVKDKEALKIYVGKREKEIMRKLAQAERRSLSNFILYMIMKKAKEQDDKNNN